MHYVYFLKSKKKKRWTYVGMTNNLDRRLEEHQAGESKYTCSYLPVHLESYIAVNTKNHAEKLEKYFKTGSGIAFMKKRILNYEALA